MGFSKADLFTIEQITSRTPLVIPEFQRGYAWREEQWAALWDDVTSVVERDAAQHYTGSVMITDAPDGEPSELIDGQQRMVTIALLLSALGDAAYPVTFRRNDVLQQCFDFHALKRAALAPAVARDRSYYARNMTKAWEYFSKKSTELDSVSVRASYVDALRHRLKLFVLTIQPEFDVHVAFETINNRGRPLSTLEKLKNRLICLASQEGNLKRSRQTTDEVHRCWKEVYASLGAGKELLADDDFLAAHATGWFRVERVADWLSTRLFDVEFSAKRSTDCDQILAYVQSLEHAAACWSLLHSPDDLPPAVAVRLRALYRTPHSASRPVLLWALIRLAHEFPKLLSEPDTDTGWGGAFCKLLWEAERFRVMVIQASGRPAHTGKADLNLSAHALAHPGTRLTTVRPDTASPPQATAAVEWASKHLHWMVDNVSDLDSGGADLFTNPKYTWSGYFSREQVQAAINDRFNKKNSSGFYGWPLARLVMLAWEERLRGTRGSVNKLRGEKFHWTDSVEHVFPQNPAPEWNESIVVSGRNKQEALAGIAGSLGNLLLLSKSFNSEVSNHPFLCKGGKDKAGRFATGSYSEMQIAKICDKWTIVEITARGIAMLQHAQNHWAFELVPSTASVDEWLPYLYGPLAERVRRGDFYHAKLNGNNVGRMVEKFKQPINLRDDKSLGKRVVAV